MKKFAIMVLCLLMCAGVALAGTTAELKQLTDTISVVYNNPEGVKAVTVEESGDLTIVTYEMEDELLPTYMLLISYSEVLGEKDIVDLTDEEIEALVAYTAFDAADYEYEMIEMDDGWPAVLIDYDGVSDWVDAFTVISGYLIQMHGYHADFAPLTDAENQMAFTLLDGVDIIHTDAADTQLSGVPNPMHESTADAFAQVAGFTPAIPDGTDALYFSYDGSGLVEAQFEADGRDYSLRAEPGEMAADISGMYETFAQEQEAEIAGLAATVKLNEGAGGVCQWYDAQAKVNYSLGVTQGAAFDALVAMAQRLVG